MSPLGLPSKYSEKAPQTQSCSKSGMAMSRSQSHHSAGLGFGVCVQGADSLLLETISGRSAFPGGLGTWKFALSCHLASGWCGQGHCDPESVAACFGPLALCWRSHGSGASMLLIGYLASECGVGFCRVKGLWGLPLSRTSHLSPSQRAKIPQIHDKGC